MYDKQQETHKEQTENIILILILDKMVFKCSLLQPIAMEIPVLSWKILIYSIMFCYNWRRENSRIYLFKSESVSQCFASRCPDFPDQGNP